MHKNKDKNTMMERDSKFTYTHKKNFFPNYLTLNQTKFYLARSGRIINLFLFARCQNKERIFFSITEFIFI